MDDKIDTQSLTAVLRSDRRRPTLHFWDALIDRNIVAEYVDYATETVLAAHLHGDLGSARTSVPMDLEQLVGLIQSLRDLTDLRTHQLVWQTADRTVEIRLSVQMQRLGPPVLCDVWLRDSVPVQEEHHCSFETNLTWVGAFLAQLESLSFRYRRAQGHPGQS